MGDVLWIQEEKLAGPILRLQGALALASLRAGQDERSPSVFAFSADSSDRWVHLGESQFVIPSFWRITADSVLLLV